MKCGTIKFGIVKSNIARHRPARCMPRVTKLTPHRRYLVGGRLGTNAGKSDPNAQCADISSACATTAVTLFSNDNHTCSAIRKIQIEDTRAVRRDHAPTH